MGDANNLLLGHDIESMRWRQISFYVEIVGIVQQDRHEDPAR